MSDETISRYLGIDYWLFRRFAMKPVEIFSSAYMEGSKLVGAGLATIGLVGAGMGVGVVFGSLLILFLVIRL